MMEHSLNREKTKHDKSTICPSETEIQVNKILFFFFFFLPKGNLQKECSVNALQWICTCKAVTS